MIEQTIDCSRRGGGGGGGGRAPRDVRGAAVRNVHILPGVDAELDELRQHVERLGPYLTETAKAVAAELTDPRFQSWHLQCVFVHRVSRSPLTDIVAQQQQQELDQDEAVPDPLSGNNAPIQPPGLPRSMDLCS